MEVGDLISLYRKQAGLTIDELAERSGVPKGTLNKITGGITKAPTLPNMKAIARALGKTLADFDDLPIQKTEKSPGPEDSEPRDKFEMEFMHYELSAEEIQHIEQYRELLPEFQAALDSQMKVLFDLQASIVKEMIQAK